MGILTIQISLNHGLPQLKKPSNLSHRDRTAHICDQPLAKRALEEQQSTWEASIWITSWCDPSQSFSFAMSRAVRPAELTWAQLAPCNFQLHGFQTVSYCWHPIVLGRSTNGYIAVVGRYLFWHVRLSNPHFGVKSRLVLVIYPTLGFLWFLHSPFHDISWTKKPVRNLHQLARVSEAVPDLLAARQHGQAKAARLHQVDVPRAAAHWFHPGRSDSPPEIPSISSPSRHSSHVACAFGSSPWLSTTTLGRPGAHQHDKPGAALCFGEWKILSA